MREMEGVLILSAKRVFFVKKKKNVLRIWRVTERNPLGGGVLHLLEGYARPIGAHSVGPKRCEQKTSDSRWRTTEGGSSASCFEGKKKAGCTQRRFG